MISSNKEGIMNANTQYNKISFYLNGKELSASIPAGLSTLDWLNKHQNMYGTKCSCNEGDCGACTVVIAYPREGSIVYEAINSCLYPAAKLHGRHLITIEAIGTPEELHPIQEAMLKHHGTQCGYCTPGFVMSMFAMFAMQSHPDKESIFSALEGNLCRCTGYQSILDAAMEISVNYSTDTIVPQWCREVEPLLFSFKQAAYMGEADNANPGLVQKYYLPEDMSSLFDICDSEPAARFIAGGTDIVVQMNISRREFPVLIDLCRIDALNMLYLRRDGLHIGAMISYSQLFESGIVKSDYPALHELINKIASRQIRNFGTIVGNIANASPIGDSLPLLLALDARLVLASRQGERIIPLSSFFIAYRKTALQQNEMIKELVLPIIPRGNYVHSIKSAKRKSVDISSVVTAINLAWDGDRICSARLALGGVASTTVLSGKFGELVIGKAASELDSKSIAEAIAADYAPLSDVRGSAEYRTKLIIEHIAIYIEQIKGRQA